jgi:glycosyltransferase involved in cell wall biosynthesis
LRPAAVIPHGISASQFTFRGEPDDYVCFLGRFTWGKGPLQAIRAAESAGVPIVLAGPRNDYYRQQIEPLVDGVRVKYAGSVSGEARDALLGGAKALLYPVQEPEPFGLVMVEAMMCGTPVVATALGAVPEIVEESVTGYFAPSPDDLPLLLTRSFALDRHLVRERAEMRFSSEAMARQYAEIYERLVETRS